MEFQTALTQTVILFIPILIGIFIRKIDLVDEGFAGNLSKFLFNVSLPCTVLNVMQMESTPEALTTGARLMLISLLATAGSYLLSLLFTHFFRRDGQQKVNIYRFCITFSNFSYMAYPISQVLYGDEGLFYTALYSLPLFVLVNSAGILILHHSGQGIRLADFKKALNLPTLAVVVGALLYGFNIRFSGPVQTLVGMFDSTTTPLAMLMAGLVLSRGNWKTVFKNWKYYLVSVMRLLVVPVLVWGVLKLCGISGLELLVPVLVSAMPVVVNIVILAANGEEADSETAANLLLISTLLSVLTIPCVTTFLR